MPRTGMPRSRKPRKSLVWLASYPKSGNTWARIFLGNYLFNRQTPMPINQVHRLGVTDAAAECYRAAAKGAFDAADPLLVLKLRDRMLKWVMTNDADVNFVKTHATKATLFGVEMIPASLSRSAIYILRNPLDMVISYSRHFGRAPDEAAAAITRTDTTIAANEKSVKQYIGNWSDHVRSWTRTRDFPVLVLRYEDMQADPRAAFTKVLTHLGVPVDAERLNRAVRFSSFDELRRQEERDGFAEHANMRDRFFHTGRSGQWRDVLPDALVEKIRRDHAAVMRDFGYLDD